MPVAEQVVRLTTAAEGLRAAAAVVRGCECDRGALKCCVGGRGVVRQRLQAMLVVDECQYRADEMGGWGVGVDVEGDGAQCNDVA